MSDTLSCTPIGYFHSSQTEKYMAAKQSPLSHPESNGRILLCPDCNYETALEDLQGFERIWLIYWFHNNHGWKPKVMTPRGGSKRGVFATRSPHRPNPIGLSCVPLIAVSGRELHIGPNDLLDGTPILDIKPYLNYADAFPESRQGWIDDSIQNTPYNVVWSQLALNQAGFIEQHAIPNFKESVELRLKDNPFPFPSHRIKEIGQNKYELALKTWRVIYLVQEHTVTIESIRSGYDEDTLQGRKASRWDDVAIHLAFCKAEG